MSDALTPSPSRVSGVVEPEPARQIAEARKRLHGGDIVVALEQMAQAYPEDIWPTPPPERRAYDSAAAHVLREMAVPWYALAAHTITTERRLLDTALEALDVLNLDGPGDVSLEQYRAMAKGVARSIRAQRRARGE